MTKSALITLHYEDEPVRVVVEEDGSLWFVVKDLGDILGFDNPLNLMNSPAAESTRLRVVKTSGGRRRVRVATPAGVFGMLFRAKKHTDITDLLRWLEQEVLSIGLRTEAWAQNTTAEQE